MPTRDVAKIAAGIPRTVLLVDDDASVRRALTRLLTVAGYRVVSFATGARLLDATEELESGPACVLADLRLPGLSGLELQVELKRRHAAVPVVFISGRADVVSGVEAMKRGAVDFLEKPLDHASLVAAIEKAFLENRHRREVQVERHDLEERAERLTPREREVFALVVTGLGNKQVGAELGATEKTIKVHRARVMEKMEAGSLAELVLMADRLGLTPTSLRQGLH
ncbi:MAG TPA: response regulator [Vicinamibacteria bacterium]|jgi:FixJ family two-component response regulator